MMRLGMFWQAMMILAALTLAGFMVRSARADVIAVEGRPMAVGVSIQDLREGRLFYELSSGRQVDRPIDQVDYLQITSWDALNEAEKLRQAGDWRGAAAAYEQILTRSPSTGSTGKLDRDLLVRCRLVNAYDEVGRFDMAVTAYLSVLNRMPEVVEGLRPKKLPTADSTFLPAAAEAVDTFIATNRGTPAGVSVAAWRLTWPDEVARTSKPTTSPADARASQNKGELAEVERLVANKRFDDALARLAPLQNAEAGLQRPEVFYWQGWAWLGKSEQPGSTGAARDARRAGLAFMRVAIHYPGHPLSAECLFRAGQLCRRAGRADLAVNLWSELVRTHPTDRVWGTQARRAITEVQPRPATTTSASE